MLNLIGQSFGRYHILEKLGEGGMAVVYKAYDTHLEREVAVKVIRTEQMAPALLDRALIRFEREAKEVSRLNHPNIVNVYDYGEYNGIPYLVMTYLHGGTLKQTMGQPIPYQQAVSLVLPIAKALEYAHQHKMIHRDVKPSNILLTDSGEVMLTDFGIAKMLEVDDGNTLTGTGMGLGTPEYMAPEQWTGQFTPAVDIYALGVVLYELVTGRKPYSADTPAAVLLKQATEPLPRPKDLITDLPDEVERVLIKALAKKPEDRYQDMKAFTTGLTRLTGGKALESSPAPRPTTVKEETMSTVMQSDSLATADHGVLPEPPPRVTTPRVSEEPIKTIDWTKVMAYAMGGLVLVTLLIIGLTSSWFTTRPAAPTATDVPLIEDMVAPTFTDQPPTATVASPPATKIPSTATSAPANTTENYTIGSTMVSPKDGMTMVYVPAGEFLMGSPEGVGEDEEHPQHTVYLDACWIDQTEVTNAMYARCVADGGCTEPRSRESYTRDSYYGNPDYDEYPVISVTWHQAEAYCQWAGRELPTEAQWEKAARGTDGRTYPWGNEPPAGNLVNFADKNTDYDWSNKAIDDGYEDTAPVGTYPDGASTYSALDMAGNVLEWVADWYGDYPSGSVSNPTGPTIGESRVLRGGSWNNLVSDIRSAFRSRSVPGDASGINFGFRCSLSASEAP